MSDYFHKQELTILRKAVDKADKLITNKNLNKPEQINNMILILEDYLRKHKLICYGGTAINNILPVEDQFYNKDTEIPDYDFFSPNAIHDAKNLADIYYKNGYTDVEAKAGVHEGTYKLFVNFIPIADITYQDSEIYNAINNDAIMIDGILYAPPNYLRMSMYLELSRPEGDVSRWEKILKRLILLNKHYPMKNPKCNSLNFMRNFEHGYTKKTASIYTIVKDSFIDQGCVFFGGFAATLYGKYMPKNEKKTLEKNPDFDVLAIDPERSAIITKERLESENIKNVKIFQRDSIGEIIPEHYEIKVVNETVAFIYTPIACHSFNKIKLDNKTVKIATIDTMLSFFLAFIYTDRAYYDRERILCMAQYLFYVQSKNRLKQKGLLRRFSISCYGEQDTIADIRSKKAQKYRFLSKRKHNPKFKKEYEKNFLKYSPEFDSPKTFKKNLYKKRNTDVSSKPNNEPNLKLENEFSNYEEYIKNNKIKNVDTEVIEEIIEDIKKETTLESKLENKKYKKRKNKTKKKNSFFNIHVPKEYWVLN